MQELTLIHFSLCLLMSGVIWMVQIVHYPSFKFIDEKSFHSFSAFHVKSISFIVLPLMLCELATATLLTIKQPDMAFIINLVLLIFIWMITFFISMPLHKKLGSKRYDQSIDKLILSNWARTVFWTARSILLFVIIISKIE
ncbi:hypothetical protein DAY19_08345 [Halobacteriovorax vibrionivorans]|uniref:DUF4149 domain-containing protein n=1 Tax=Halobacteriovorax vibrionivorans TaxID=2152716 RepID=A0ABY0IFI2_9BACT|nr:MULTISPECIES: hypothetical protein [Halobacteriovorax]RZF21689.1 hypothetical protein DAY19_08345 [Halobacteriovorax vibrionivorans]TGD49018.1 hypothetical protein EP118_00695 [Halobacteriovorax sp. Y22]